LIGLVGKKQIDAARYREYEDNGSGADGDTEAGEEGAGAIGTDVLAGEFEVGFEK